MIRVTVHACQRFVERVCPCSLEQAREAILSHSWALERIAAFGGEVVRLGDGSRLILKGQRVVTVLSRDGNLPHQICNPYSQRAH